MKTVVIPSVVVDENNEPLMEEPKIVIAPNPRWIPYFGGPLEFVVESTSSWDTSAIGTEWLQASVIDGANNRLEIMVDENPLPISRSAEFKVINKEGEEDTVKIMQGAAPVRLSLISGTDTFAMNRSNNIILDATAGQKTLLVKSNTSWMATKTGGWIENIHPDKGNLDGSLFFNYQEHLAHDNGSRHGTISVMTFDSSITITIHLLQTPKELGCSFDGVNLTFSDCKNDGNSNYFEVYLNPFGHKLGSTYSVFDRHDNLIIGGLAYGSPSLINEVVEGYEMGTVKVIDDMNGPTCMTPVFIPQQTCSQNPQNTDGPDYIVTNIEDLPFEVCPGKSYTLYGTIRNVGTQDAVSQSKAYYILRNPSTGVEEKLEDANMGGLRVNGVDRDREEVTIPNWEPGLYEFIYRADATNQISEVSENNNSFSQMIQIRDCGNQKKPDYVVKSWSKFQEGTAVCPGQQFTMWARVKNVGKKSYARETRAFYWLSEDMDLDTSEDRLLRHINEHGMLEQSLDHIPGLQVQEDIKKYERVQIPRDIETGRYWYIIYQVDADYDINRI